MFKRWSLAQWFSLLALIVNISIALSYINFWRVAIQQDLLWQADFSAFYTGWAIVRDGKGEQLYDFKLQTEYQRNLLGGRSFAGGLLAFNYPPHTALLLMPLAWFPRPVSFWLWTVIQVLLLIWVLQLLARISYDWDAGERRHLYITVLALPSLLFSLLGGSFSLLVLVSLLKYYLALKASCDTRAGLWLALGSIKPQSLILPGIILLSGRRWRAVITLAMIGAVLFFISSMGLGWHIWPDFARVILEVGQTSNRFGIYPENMYNLRGLLTTLLDAKHSWIAAVSTGLMVASMLFTFWLWNRPWQPQERKFILHFSFTILMSLFFSPHLNRQDGLLFIIPAVLFYDYLRQRNLPRKAYAVFMLSAPSLFFLSEFILRDRVSIRLPALVIVVLSIWIGWGLWKDRQSLKPQ